MEGRIPELASKYKARAKRIGEAWAIPLCLVLFGLTAFGLGRLSVMEGAEGRLLIKLPDGAVQTAAAYEASRPATGVAPKAAAAGGYVASKNGSKYYPIGCAGVSRIKEENKVYFESAIDAQAAGYTPAANC